MKKRVLSLLICAAMLAAFTVNAYAIGMDGIKKSRTYEGQFTDIRGKWCEEYIADLYERSLAEGKSADKLCPDELITVAEVITLSARINAAYYERDIAPSNGKWYTQYVDYAVKNGIVTSAMAANPEKEATRGETAVILAKALPSEQYEAVNKEKTFFDVLRQDNAYEAVSKLSKAGIVTGYEDMSFRPDAAVTRAEAMTMADRVVNKELRLGYITDSGNSSSGSRDEEVGDYVTFTSKSVASLTMNRRDGGIVLTVSTLGGTVAVSGIGEIRQDAGLVCVLGDRVVQGEGLASAGEGIVSLVFAYDGGRSMTLTAAVDSSGRLISTKGTAVIGVLCIGTSLTAVN